MHPPRRNTPRRDALDSLAHKLIYEPKDELEWMMSNQGERKVSPRPDLLAVTAALSRLTEQQRELLLAYFGERLSYSELGTRIGHSKPHAWRHTQAALTALTAELVNDPAIRGRFHEEEVEEMAVVGDGD
jgi:DNA-directed RNA polymerase specialized sigma24 family protein